MTDWREHGVRIVHAGELDPNTAQTPGMSRAAAIDHARAGARKLWAGTVTIHPSAKTGAHHHGLLPAAHEHAFERLVGRVDLLVRHVGRDEDEVARARLGDILEPLAPPHPRPAVDDVDHALQGTVVMGPGLGIRVDHHGAGPQLLGAGTRRGDRRGPVHARRLRRVDVELVGVHNANAVQPPVGVAVVRSGI